MQGQRGPLGSLPDTIGFVHVPTSSDTSIEQQIYWNSTNNSANTILPDYMTSPAAHGNTYGSSMTQRQTLSGWSVGEPSSSVQHQPGHSEQKTEQVWPSSSSSAFSGAGSLLGLQQYEPTIVVPPDSSHQSDSTRHIASGPVFAASSSSDAIHRDLNMNADAEHVDDDCHIMEHPNANNLNGSENMWMPSVSSASDPFAGPSGNRGYLAEENDGRAGCSLEGRRLSCKRKALEGHGEQSSGHGEATVWPAVPPLSNASGSLSISTPQAHNLAIGPAEHMNGRLGLGTGVASESLFALNVAGNAESSHRNLRLRINSSRQQESVPRNEFPVANTLGNSSVSQMQQLSRLLSLNNSLDARAMPLADHTSPQRQSAVGHVPALRRTAPSTRWNRGSSSRHGNSPSFVNFGVGETAIHGDSNSISNSRNISEHHVFFPATELRNVAQHSTNWNLSSGNVGVSGNVASTSRSGASSNAHSSSAPSWFPHGNAQYPRRLSGLVRRSLLSSAGLEPGGSSSSNATARASPSTPQEMVLSPGVGEHGHQLPLPHSRSAALLERQLDGALGLPYSLRTLAAASEGRSRLMSEIRNVLDHMRRGEGLRFEDVMILDQSVFFRMADIHDRHRDMRLDVDNMSYEELLALEDRIGYVNTGLSGEMITNHLKQRKYFSIAMGSQMELEPCCICQEEYNDREDIGTLDCGHEFHAGCIKQWLMQKNLCPICKTTGLSTS